MLLGWQRELQLLNDAWISHLIRESTLRALLLRRSSCRWAACVSHRFICRFIRYACQRGHTGIWCARVGLTLHFANMPSWEVFPHGLVLDEQRIHNLRLKFTLTAYSACHDLQCKTPIFSLSMVVIAVTYLLFETTNLQQRGCLENWAGKSRWENGV
jgi:hypothetical protein